MRRSGEGKDCRAWSEPELVVTHGSNDGATGGHDPDWGVVINPLMKGWLISPTLERSDAIRGDDILGNF